MLGNDTLLIIAIGLVLPSGVILALQYLFRQEISFPKHVPVVGVRDEMFSVARASCRQLTNGMTTLLEGYRNHAQHNRPFVLYDPSAQQELLLPVQHIRWFSEQPDIKLNSLGVREERHAVRYLHMGDQVELESTTRFIRYACNDRLNRHLEDLQGVLYGEIRRGIDSAFERQSQAKDDGWREVSLHGSMQEVVFPAMCRVFLGKGLGDSDGERARVLTTFQWYLMAMGLSTIFIGELPRVLKGLVARVVRVPLAYYRTKTLQVLVPLVESRLSSRTKQASDDEDGSNFIDHCAKLSEKRAVGGRSGETAAPELIAEWIMMLGFAGSSSTIIQATNLLLDLVHAPPELEALQRLRHEAETTVHGLGDPNDNSKWTQASSFREQILADSAIRESLRLHPILIKGLTKEVVAPNGLELPDDNHTHLPAGSWVGVPVLGIHQDERFYPQAAEYQPFRFVKDAKPSHTTATGGTYEDEPEAAKPTTTYLGFGYGRHACPGRWFAVLILKMILSYVTVHYDIQPTGPPPQTNVLGDAVLPPFRATMKVRRRKVAQTARDGV
ncbi:cytochrome P450 [Chaetomidium leptoderma]|uniref:Cytochrome P450 n=1 Tax=Chaetomidium leptoderma TaxID=669021 RepID=A0AAN6ZVF1_9PEZI|nr:cytochrome P450 [Chaetomidium leptoderma]